MLSHRRQSIPQSEAARPFISSSPYLVPLPSSPLLHTSLNFKLPPTIEDADFSPVDHEGDGDGVPNEKGKDHAADPRTVNDLVCAVRRQILTG